MMKKSTKFILAIFFFKLKVKSLATRFREITIDFSDKKTYNELDIPLVSI
jgi:hypothetical protein